VRYIHVVIIMSTDPQEYACLTSRKLIWCLPGMLQRFPGNLEQHSLLGIHMGSLARRNTEKLRIEEINVLQEASAGRPTGTGSRLGALAFPAISGKLAGCIRTGKQQLPECLRVSGSRNTTCKANHRNRFTRKAGSTPCSLRGWLIGEPMLPNDWSRNSPGPLLPFRRLPRTSTRQSLGESSNRRSVP